MFKVSFIHVAIVAAIGIGMAIMLHELFAGVVQAITGA